MKVVHHSLRREPRGIRLGDVQPGSVIEFVEPFSQNCPDGSLWIKGNPVCMAYIPDRYAGKIPVIDIRAGVMTLVDRDRRVFVWKEAYCDPGTKRREY